MDEVVTSQSGEIYLATVIEIGTNGLKIKLDGSDEAGDKEYKANVSSSFKEGDRVLALKISGTFVVMCTVGKPNERSIPANGTGGYCLKKRTAADYDLYWARVL